jgi:RHS repeat-associated protein
MRNCVRLFSLMMVWSVRVRIIQHGLICLICLILFASHDARGQNVQFTQGEVGSGLENTLQISLGSYPGRGVSLPINLYYSSNVMRIGYIKSVYVQYGVRNAVAEAIFAEHSTAGWKSSLDVPIIQWPESDDIYWYSGKPYDHSGVWPYTFRMARLYVHMPDGSTHELRKSDQPYHDSAGVDYFGTFYAVDGSRLRYDSGGPTTGTLYLPDGSRFILNGGDAQFVDRNGNTLNYNGSTRQWTDTLGRVIGNPLPASPGPGDYAYTLPAVGGGTMTYTLKWRSLSTVLTNGGAIKNLSSHYLPTPWAPPTDPSGGNFPQPASGESLFSSGLSDEENANSQVWVVGRGQGAGQQFNPTVLAEIVLPNGLSYSFSYTIYGEIDKIIYPTGGFATCEFSNVPQLGGNNDLIYSQSSRGVIRRHVSANGSGNDLVTWEYSSTGTIITTKSPDGTETEVYRHNFGPGGNGYAPFGFEDARKGMPYDERVYARNPDGSRGPMLRRKLTNWIQSTNTVPPRPDVPPQNNSSVSAYRNARADREVSILLDTGSQALTKSTSFGYDATFQFSVGLDQTSVTDYGYYVLDSGSAQTSTITGIPSGEVFASTYTSYLTGDANYRNRNILGLASSVIIQDAVGQTVAQNAMSYDEFALTSYGAVTGWNDPQTNYRGNLTSMRRWLDTPSPGWIENQTQYDQCGSPRTISDGKGNQSQIQYTDSYSDSVSRNTYAYPTTTITPIPDPSGGRGYPASFTSGSVFDFNTGLARSTADANGNTTLFEYNDPMNRPTKVTRPDGSWTATTYNDVVGNLYVRTQTLQEATPSQRVIDGYQFFDKLGRPSRSFLKEGTTYLTNDTQYDSVGRTWRVSNPYRTASLSDSVNPANMWTTNTYDVLGRVIVVTTADNAQELTSYALSTSGTAIGTTVSVTDQTSKSRRSITDARGRLIRVIEDPGNLAYETNYTYDALNNLRQVQQDTQLRYFGYDSLSRLIRVRNIEQTINPALNWVDPVTGYAGGWTAAFTYDQNGNLTSRTDARNITTNYEHDALNRMTTVRYVNDPQNTPGVDYFYDGYRGGANYSVSNSKGQAWQVETGGQTLVSLSNFDVLGRAGSQSQQFYINGQWSQPYTVSRTFDYAGHPKTQTYPSGRTVNYAFDDAGRTSSFSGNLGDSAWRTYSQGITYSVYGGPSQEHLGTSTPVYNKSFYNVRGQLAEIRVSTTANDTWWNRGAIINHYSDQCWGMCSGSSMTDNNGNLKRQEVYIPGDDSISSWTLSQDVFGYDRLNRLNSTIENSGSNTQGQTQAWSQYLDYDRWGNRTSSVTHMSLSGGAASAPNTQQTLGLAVRTMPTQLLKPVNTSGLGGPTQMAPCDDCPIAEPPEAYPGGPYSGQVGEAIQFDGSGSYDPDGWIVDYSWNFGDGQTASGPTPVHSYSGAGTYTVTLTVRDNTNRMGTSSTTATISSQPPTNFNNAAFVAQSVPTSMTAGQTYSVSVTMQNTGTTIWRAATAHRLGSQNPQDNGTWGIGRVELPSDVMPNAQATFSFSVTAPQAQGVYDFQWRMVQDGVEWFGDYTPNVQVSVTSAPSSAQLVVDPATNRALATNGTIGYDAAGNITNDSYSGSGGRSYDAENRMTAAQDVTGGTSYYGYDGSSKRVRRISGGVETWEIYGFSDELIAEYSANVSPSAPQKEYGYRNGQLLITAAPSADIHWLIADHLGTPRMILDASGSLSGVSRHDYMPFGEELYAATGMRTAGNGYINSDGARQKFTSKERDNETGLDYFGERYYSSAMGRFTIVDPLGASARLSEPQSMNRYTFVLNNPLRYVDPDGLKQKAPWDQLNEEEKRALAPKLIKVKDPNKITTKELKTAGQKFNNLVTVKGNAQATADRIATAKNFVQNFSKGGPASQNAVYQQIDQIKRIGVSAVEVTVRDKDQFLTALANAGYAVNSADEYVANAYARITRGKVDHPFDSARAPTIYDSDPELHFANDRSDDPDYGPNYFFAHWDPTSVNCDFGCGVIGRATSGMEHSKGHASPAQVRDYLKRMKNGPVRE